MDELSRRIYEHYEAWKDCRSDVDRLMNELMEGVAALEQVDAAIEEMQRAWLAFEVASEPILHRGSRRGR